ncbi:TrbI F-type domain-containing protein [Escherichia coli]|uniref:TrbI F-type domain-containing protein n=1 Tax=Escherichia coli TaxID=562 RepID=UPI0032B38573
MDKTQSLIPSAGTPEKSPTKCSRRRRYLKSVAGVVAGMMVLNAAVSLLLTEWRQPKTVSFDMAGTVNSFMSQAAAQALDEARITRPCPCRFVLWCRWVTASAWRSDTGSLLR